jgi:DNA-binding beta-propeller fold protein YncE
MAMAGVRMTHQWTISTVAGTGEPGHAGDGGPALHAQLHNPFDLAFDPAGNLVFSDTYNHCLRRIGARSGSIATIAGNTTQGFSGDGGPATNAQLNQPYGVTIDRAGNIYTADRLNKRVRRIDGATGIITTLAGEGSPSGEPMAEPNGLALDPAHRLLYIADVADHRVRVADLATGALSTGALSTFAGTGAAEHSGDGGKAIEAGIFGARAVAATPDGTVYILERQGSTLRRVRAGMIETIAGTGARAYGGDGHDARHAAFNAPKEMALDADGNVLIVDTESHVIRRIDARTWIVTTIAGSGIAGGGGDGGPATRAGLSRPHGAVVGPDGAIYIGDSENHRIRKLTPAV